MMTNLPTLRIPVWTLLAAVWIGLVAPAGAQPPDFTGLVERVSPAVVNIEATRTAEAAFRQGAPQFEDEEIPEIFRRFFGQPGMPAVPRDRTSSGSGFILSQDGYLLTNRHVVDGADQIVVRLVDRREYDAEVIGSDAQTDIALLRIQGSDLPAVAVGDSDALRPGEWVVAIGSPFGFDHSVTAGIVSAVGRTSRMSGQQYVPFIQTDVPINRGNSGGPLFNTRGEVVGINSQIFSNTGGYMGVSFAIPIEVAMNSVQQLKHTGRVSRGLLGVNIQEVTREMAQSLGLSRPRGALVFGFSEDSAASEAGVQLGDVIVSYQGRPILRSSDLPPMVGATAPGTKVSLEVFRDGRTLKIPVSIGALEGPPATARAEDRERAAGTPLGLVVQDLTEAQRTELGLEKGEGVIVTAVSGISARRAGLQEGDVILMVGRDKVDSERRFRELIAGAEPDRPVMLLVRRGEQSQFVAVTPRKAED
ncbi:MAG TPA: DegQ family serine endoprotease [Xanthomonadaceae bacterium]|nr:DegQ family serine endoprotease [Xanthomonadaceae bacterium]